MKKWNDQFESHPFNRIWVDICDLVKKKQIDKEINEGYLEDLARLRKVIDHLDNIFKAIDPDIFSIKLLSSIQSTAQNLLNHLTNLYENKNINALKNANDFADQLLPIFHQFPSSVSSIKKTNITTSLKAYKDTFSSDINEFKSDSEDTLKELKDKVDGLAHTVKSKEDRINDLENVYQNLLKLSEPAKYWEDRAFELKKEGWKAAYWTGGLVIVVSIALFCMLWITPEGMLISFSKCTESAIRWTVLFITFLSFMAFGIRVFSKVIFSSFHLARDAEERKYLTYFYLALLKDTEVDEKDRQMIMQALFSRSETGLLKDDSSPAMPTVLPKKFFE